MCFHNDGKTAQATKCIKSRIIIKVIYSVLFIDTLEQYCVVLKAMLQSPRLKYHVKTIGIDQLLNNNALFEHKCLQNIRKLYNHAGKCDYQQQFKDILESTMVSTPKGFTNNSPRSPTSPTLVNKPRARKALCHSLTHYMQKRKLLPINSELLNQRAEQLSLELHHGY